MEAKEYCGRVSEFRSQLFELLSTDPLAIHDVLTNRPSRFNLEGVYAISVPHDSEIVYVGKTRTKSVIERLRDHRSIDTKSDLKGMLKLFSSYPQEIDNYLVRCAEVTDARKRTMFEHFLISILQPPFNK